MATIIIVGAGPAGLFAAEQLAQKGQNVHIYDHKPSPARKFLMAGRGGLNITHSEPFADFLLRYGPAADFLRPVLESFNPQDMRNWCHSLGEDTFIGSSGRVFPNSFKASPLLRAWLGRLNQLGVNFHFNQRWVGLHPDQKAEFQTPDGPQRVPYDALLLALGGASWPRLGSDANWTGLLTAHDILIHPFQSSNCGFCTNWSDVFRTRFSGTPLKSITLRVGDQISHGEIMITDKGIEGGGIYALSASLRQALKDSDTVRVFLDLKPDYTAEKLATLIGKPFKGSSFGNHLRKVTGLSPVAIGLLQEDRGLKSFQPAELAQKVKNFPLVLTRAFDLDRAISSAGGVALAEVDARYMLKKLPGIFVAGEMLDWDAPTGGYLLQACFATARAAALGIIDFLGQSRPA